MVGMGGNRREMGIRKRKGMLGMNNRHSRSQRQPTGWKRASRDISTKYRIYTKSARGTNGVRDIVLLCASAQAPYQASNQGQASVTSPVRPSSHPCLRLWQFLYQGTRRLADWTRRLPHGPSHMAARLLVFDSDKNKGCTAGGRVEFQRRNERATQDRTEHSVAACSVFSACSVSAGCTPAPCTVLLDKALW